MAGRKRDNMDAIEVSLLALLAFIWCLGGEALKATPARTKTGEDQSTCAGFSRATLALYRVRQGLAGFREQVRVCGMRDPRGFRLYGFEAGRGLP